jgi:predicted DNA-binding protein (UPF0251 family)
MADLWESELKDEIRRLVSKNISLCEASNEVGIDRHTLSKYIAKYQPEKRRDVAQIVVEKRGRKSFLSEESEDILRLAI